jgi:hypothetical protein
MDSIEEAFGTLADADMWEEAAAVLAGFLLPFVLDSLAGDRLPIDVPREGYAAAVMVLAMYAPMYSGEMQLGGAVATVDALLDRFGVRDTITDLGGS